MKDMKNTPYGDRGECNEESCWGPLRADPGLDQCLDLSVKCELHEGRIIKLCFDDVLKLFGHNFRR